MSHLIRPLIVSAYTATTALGAGKAALSAALHAARSGLRPNDFADWVGARLATWIGRVEEVETLALPPGLGRWDCRNNRLAWLGLQQDGFAQAVAAARQRHGAERVAVVMGTSTSSIVDTEQAYAHLDAQGNLPGHIRDGEVHTTHSLGRFVQVALGLEGPCQTVSTACASSAKTFACAERMIRIGLVDAAVVGGADSLCASVLYGFNSLELLSDMPCQPFDLARRGISVAEASGFALLERPDGRHAPQLLGHGESSDAYHMSAPHPRGAGAELALDDALRRAGLCAQDIDYINLHGTGTLLNDQVEGSLVARRFPAHTHASSTKGITGHALGAAGIVEAVVCLLALETGLMPGTANSTQLDPLCGPQIRLQPALGHVRHALSNSFGFGGNNCVLIFGKGTGP